MAAIKTYAPDKVSVVLGGAIMSGYAEDGFVKIEVATEAFTKHVGADGEVSRTRNTDKSGTITLKLKQTSDSNDVLSALYNTDITTLQGYLPVIVKDNVGRTLAAGSSAWIQKLPEAEFGKEIGDREWIIEVADLQYFVGGND
jgi:hypothetical protein